MWDGIVHKGYKWYLGGPGGTGKSHVIQLIRWGVIYFLQQTMKVQPDEPLVLLTAPTGLAAFNIGGITYILHLCCNAVITQIYKIGKKGSTMYLKLKNTVLCVMDEVSMIGGPPFSHVSDTFKKIKQNSDDWGGVAILAVGDFYQLPPVGQTPVYRQPKKIRSPSDLAPLLWDDFMIHELDQVMRQKDKEFAYALNRICKAPPEIH